MVPWKETKVAERVVRVYLNTREGKEATMEALMEKTCRGLGVVNLTCHQLKSFAEYFSVEQLISVLTVNNVDIATIEYMIRTCSERFS